MLAALYKNTPVSTDALEELLIQAAACEDESPDVIAALLRAYWAAVAREDPDKTPATYPTLDAANDDYRKHWLAALHRRIPGYVPDLYSGGIPDHLYDALTDRADMPVRILRQVATIDGSRTAYFLLALQEAQKLEAAG